MAERTILVCDVCGRPAVQTVGLRVGRRNLQKDYCEIHLQELTAGARAPRPGRRRGVVVPASPAKRRGRPPKQAASAAKRRPRPRKTKTAASG
jgi:hypothetical protein